MPSGWIRAYADELERFGFRDRSAGQRNARARFRADFSTPLLQFSDPQSATLATLRWGDVAELPGGLSGGEMTEVVIAGQRGFVRSAHLAEIAYVKRRGTSPRGLRATLSYRSGGKTRRRELLWGDLVQILSRGDSTSSVRGRGYFGEMKNAELTSEPLLEVYFIDVGQGDGILVRTPDGRHLMVDGGLERGKQLTGKSAADFVDWKFFYDYGEHRIRLDGMTASHSDNDHYGGLHDLVRLTAAAERELDCLGTDIAVLHHPGLSRWETRPDRAPPHRDGLGPRTADGLFVRLLGDRADAEAAVLNGAPDELSGPWKSFVRDALGNCAAMRVERLAVAREALDASEPPPELWPAALGCAIRVLAPVTVERDGAPALRDLGARSINTNGHSVCLRIDYGKARILLTGDLNRASMDWLRECYRDRIGAFECDVAKACHHGSHDISYQFLEAMRPAATVISSGDAEGHGHPRPEIVGASAISGFASVDRERDVLLTPLIYMTEVERSVSLGAVNRIDFAGVPADSGRIGGTLPGRYLDELTATTTITPREAAQIARAPTAERAGLRNAIRARLRALEAAALGGEVEARYYYSVPQGPLSAQHRERPVWRSRIMEKNHYGLVNVRTDGEQVMCATLDETEEDWITHLFPARFPAP